MNTIALIAAYGGLLLLVNEFFRRSKWANLAWVVVPVLLTPWWLVVARGADWFHWAKSFLLIGSAVIISFQRFVAPTSPFVKAARKGMFLTNIVAAIALDARAATDPAHAINAVTGVVLCFGMADSSTQYVDRDGYKDSHWDLGWFWIFGYTFWNWALLRMSYPDIAVCQIAVLAVPVVVALALGRSAWGQARSYTVSALVISMMTLPTPGGGVAALDLPFSSPVPTYVAIAVGFVCASAQLVLKTAGAKP